MIHQNNEAWYLIILLIFILSFNINKSYSQVTDIEGNNYKSVIIGYQEWMAENLNVSCYRNGDTIPQVQSFEEWRNLTTGAWCYYGNDSENGLIYGKLYNWFAVNDSRGLAPEGWHIPNDAEWTVLVYYLRGDSIAGGKMKATYLWDRPNIGATNESGFSALPGGFRNFYGDFDYIGRDGCFWSSSEQGNLCAWYRIIINYREEIFRFIYFNKKDGISVRCVKN